MKKTIYALITLIFLPSMAYAFPIAEGVSAIATLSGILTTLIASLFPSLYARKNIKPHVFFYGLSLWSIAFTSISIYLFLLPGEDTDIAIQSRPDVELIKEKNESKEYPYKLSNYKAFLDKKAIIIDIQSFYNLKKNSYKIINLDYNPQSKDQYPYKTTLLKATPANIEQITSLAKKYNSKIILFSNDLLKSADISKTLFDKTGILLPIINNYLIDYRYSQEDLLKILSSEKMISVKSDDFFNQEFIDIRNYKDIRETHTLENAANLSLGDLYHMTDEEIVTYLSKFKNPIFISDEEKDYVLAERRLSRINHSYKYLKDGLKNHYKNNYSITPYYLNMGKLIGSIEAMKYYMKDANIRFICTEKDYCNDNLPSDSTYYFSFRDLGKESAKEVIKNLSSEYRYIAITNNQEMDGNAILTGYWLNSSGKVYLGRFALSDRFSLEHIRKEFEVHGGNLKKYREEQQWLSDLANNFKKLINKFGWLSTFLILGLLFRILLTPFQIPIYKSYYSYTTNNKVVLSSLVVIFSLILGGFYFLDNLITNYGVIPHKTIDELNAFPLKSYLELLFVSMISIQSFISFPLNKRIFYFVLSLIGSVYFLGYIDGVNLPILVFLCVSEFISLFIQIPFYAKFKKLVKLQNNGIFTTPFKGMEYVPEKWLLANIVAKTEGFLVKTTTSIDLVKNQINWDSTKYIIRSCSLNNKESKLGGYYESVICERKDIEKSYLSLKNQSLDFVWIQPYYETSYNGVIQSVSKFGKGILLITGTGDSATEGKKSATSKIISRKDCKKIHIPGISLLLKAEKIFDSPLQLEFGFDGKKTILYQVRLDSSANFNLFKTDISNYVLAESLVTKTTYLTGSIIEHISNKDFIFIDGFLFEKKKKRYRKIYATQTDLVMTNNHLKEIETFLSDNSVTSLGLFSSIQSLLDEYRMSYNLSKSYKVFMDTPITFNKIYLSKDGSEYEISSDKFIDNNVVVNISNFREFNHYNIIKITYLLHIAIKKYSKMNGNNNPWDMKIEEILAQNLIIPTNRTYSTSPITEESSSQSNIIVPGKIKGIAWHINSITNHELPPIDDGKSYILVGEEIPSSWVKYLDKFSGIISAYGHEASHLAISAKELKIPYLKVSIENHPMHKQQVEI